MAFDFDMLKMNMEGSAEWRRRKAEEYPRDAQRNLEAAAVFDKLAETMGDVSPQTRARYEAIIDKDRDRGSMALGEVEAEITASIHISYKSAEEFIADVCERAESKLEDADEDEAEGDDEGENVVTPFDIAKLSERSVRRRAEKVGYRIAKSRGDEHINNRGQYQLIDSAKNLVVLGSDYDASLEQIDVWLREKH